MSKLYPLSQDVFSFCLSFQNSYVFGIFAENMLKAKHRVLHHCTSFAMAHTDD